MRSYVVLLGIVIVTAISACSNPKDATESNFKLAVQKYLDTEYPKCYFSGNFPAKTKDWDITGENATMKALAKAGLLSEKEVSRKEVSDGWGMQKKTVVIYAYDLTDEGKKSYKKGTDRTRGGFCGGNAKVTSIEEFSEPADLLGHKVSKVRYSYVVSNVPAWATSDELISLNRSLKKDVESSAKPIVETNTMILTNNGWVHGKLYKE